MGKLKSNKIKSTTIVEVIVAMVIILTVITITFSFYMEINKSSNYVLKLRAHLLSEEIINKTKSKKEFLDQTYKYENIIIQKIIKPYENYDDLRKIEIIASSSDNMELFQKYEIVNITD